MKPRLNKGNGWVALRHIGVDDFGVPLTRDIPIYNLAGVVAEHQRRIGLNPAQRAA